MDSEQNTAPSTPNSTMPYKSLTSLIALLITLAINPFVLQGCFLRCPELKPYDSTQQRQTTAKNLEQTIVMTRDDGALELQLSNVNLFPNRSRYASQVLSFNLIQQAHAMASCQTRDAPPATYMVTAKLKATWIPTDGDAVVLANNVSMAGTIDSSVASSGNGAIRLNGTTQTFSGTLNFVRGQGKSQLNASTLDVNVADKTWEIQTSKETVTQLQITP